MTTDFCPISTCTNFWNIEHLIFGSEGYIRWKNKDVEHFDTEYACSPEGRNAAIKIAERCRFLESKGKTVSAENVIWKWDTMCVKLIQEARTVTKVKELVTINFLDGELKDDIKRALKYRGYDIYNEDADLQEICSKRRAVKVSFDNDDSITTEINGTVKSISEYYAFGKIFNLGIEDDKMVGVTSLEFLN